MAKRTTTAGDNGFHRHTRAAFRGEKMFLAAFEHTPVLDPMKLLETLKRLRKGNLNKDAALASLLRFTNLVKMVGDMSSLFGPESARDCYGLSQEDLAFLVGCWERAGRPRMGARVSRW